ncbi:hypothetical protein Tco_0407240 [Tanacetum coccineum]
MSVEYDGGRWCDGGMEAKVTAMVTRGGGGEMEANVTTMFMDLKRQEAQPYPSRLADIIAEGFGILKGVAHGVADNVLAFKSMITHLTKNDANEAFDRFNSPKSVTSIDNKVTETAEEYALKRTGEYLAETFF